jgi:hypothetical protein
MLKYRKTTSWTTIEWFVWSTFHFSSTLDRIWRFCKCFLRDKWLCFMCIHRNLSNIPTDFVQCTGEDFSIMQQSILCLYLMCIALGEEALLWSVSSRLWFTLFIRLSTVDNCTKITTPSTTQDRVTSERRFSRPNEIIIDSEVDDSRNCSSYKVHHPSWEGL